MYTYLCNEFFFRNGSRVWLSPWATPKAAPVHAHGEAVTVKAAPVHAHGEAANVEAAPVHAHEEAYPAQAVIFSSNLQLSF